MAIMRAICGLMVAALMVQPLAAAECLKDNQEAAAIEGRLSVGRAKNAAGRPQQPYILTLKEPACLIAEDPADSVKSTQTIHAFAGTPALQAALKAAVGQAVVLRGRPFAAHTAHHHAPIVMEIVALELK